MLGDGQVRPFNVREVPDHVMVDYKKRLAYKLIEHGMHGEVIAKNTPLKQYIEKYVEENVINCKVRDGLQGIVKKLAHMEIRLPNGETVSYPIIHTYRGHNLVETTIFYIDAGGNPTYEVVPLEVSSIIISS